MLKENTLGTCRIRKPKTLWERGNVFSKPYASATNPRRLRGKIDKTKSRQRKLNQDWFKSLTAHYLYNKLPIIPTGPSPLVRAGKIAISANFASYNCQKYHNICQWKLKIILIQNILGALPQPGPAILLLINKDN